MVLRDLLKELKERKNSLQLRKQGIKDEADAKIARVQEEIDEVNQEISDLQAYLNWLDAQ